eukprot:m.138576 g.138576  ORF g.138576 m.138576 type:complete len:931 (+) comp30003_c0_seq3:3-2795(+)
MAFQTLTLSRVLTMYCSDVKVFNLKVVAAVIAFFVCIQAHRFEDGPATSGPFLDRSSIRRYFAIDHGAGQEQPPHWPWPSSLKLTGVSQLMVRRNTNTAWVRETTTGKVWLLDSAGPGLVSVMCEGIPLVVADGTHLVSIPSSMSNVNKSVSTSTPSHDMIAVLEPTRLRWLACSVSQNQCNITESVVSSVGVVLSAVSNEAGFLWLGTSLGLAFSSHQGAPQLVPNITNQPVLTVSVAGDHVALATAETVWWRKNGPKGKWAHLGVGGVVDPNITALCFLATDTASGDHFPPLAIGTSHALHILGANGVVARFSGEQGLPVDNPTSLHFDTGSNTHTNASLWISTPNGLVELLNAVDTGNSPHATPTWRYYNGDRWLVQNPLTTFSSVTALVTALAVGSRVGGDGNDDIVVWVATDTGVATIRLASTTLEDKVAHYQSMVSPRHDRYGWVAQVPLAAYGNTDSFVPTDGDNDGSNTGFYLASQVFKYSVTHDADSLRESWKSLAALEFLHNVTRPFSQKPGFIARTAVRCGEPHQGPSGGVCSSGCKCPGPVNSTCPGCSPPPGSCTGCACAGWQNSSECYTGVDAPGSHSCCWSFKSDTSTDETDGHFYALHIAYDNLAQSEIDKVRIARLICNAASYIVDGGLNYIDPLTHNRTTWGYWSPTILNGVGVGSSNGVGDNGKPNERGLNSLELISYLSVAHKVCHAHPSASPPLRQPAKGSYGDIIADVLDQGYGENILNVHLTNPGYANQGIAWFDYGNAFFTYYSLSRAAPWNTSNNSPVPLPPSITPDMLVLLKEQFYLGFEAYWASRTDNAYDEHNGLWSVIYTAITGKKGFADPMWFLRRGPRELTNWPARNSQRLDIEIRKDWLMCCNTSLSTKPLPPDESPDARWEDDSPYPLDGGDGYFETAPTLYLHAYWMARYHKVVER